MVRLSKVQIQNIVKLRSNGYSFPEISNELKIPKTTVFHHARKIKVKPEFVKLLSEKQGGSKFRMKIKEREAYLKGLDYAKDLKFKEKICLLSFLYWGEGNKKDFSLSNTDPKLIKLFVTLLREVFNVTSERIRGGIRIYQDLNREECLDFWSKLTGISKENFTGIQVLEGKKVGKLKYGMCRVRLLRGEKELKILKGLYSAIGDTYAPIA